MQIMIDHKQLENMDYFDFLGKHYKWNAAAIEGDGPTGRWFYNGVLPENGVITPKHIGVDKL
jgi:hypothetical protein